MKVSLLFIVVFVTYPDTNKTMIRFYGRKFQIHRIKSKSVKNDYKWFFLIDSITSYIVNFTPDVCMVGKIQNVTDKIDNKGDGKIIAMIKLLVHPLADNMEEFTYKKKYFVIELENYFTLTNLMAMLREFMISVVRNLRFRPRWPGQNVK